MLRVEHAPILPDDGSVSRTEFFNRTVGNLIAANSACSWHGTDPDFNYDLKVLQVVGEDGYEHTLYTASREESPVIASVLTMSRPARALHSSYFGTIMDPDTPCVREYTSRTDSKLISLSERTADAVEGFNLSTGSRIHDINAELPGTNSEQQRTAAANLRADLIDEVMGGKVKLPSTLDISRVHPSMELLYGPAWTL